MGDKLLSLADEANESVVKVTLADGSCGFSLSDLFAQFCQYTTKCGKHDVDYLVSDDCVLCNEIKALIQVQVVPTKGRPLTISVITKDGLKELVALLQSNQIQMKTRLFSLVRSSPFSMTSPSSLLSKRGNPEEDAKGFSLPELGGEGNEELVIYIEAGKNLAESLGCFNDLKGRTIGNGSNGGKLTVFPADEFLCKFYGFPAGSMVGTKASSTNKLADLLHCKKVGRVVTGLVAHEFEIKGVKVPFMTTEGLELLAACALWKQDMRWKGYTGSFDLKNPLITPTSRNREFKKEDMYTAYVPFYPAPKEMPVFRDRFAKRDPDAPRLKYGECKIISYNDRQAVEKKRRTDTGYYSGPYFQTGDLRRFSPPTSLPNLSVPHGKHEFGFLFVTMSEKDNTKGPDEPISLRVGLTKKDLDGVVGRLDEELVCWAPTYYGNWYRTELWDRYKTTKNLKDGLVEMSVQEAKFMRWLIKTRHFQETQWKGLEAWMDVQPVSMRPKEVEGGTSTTTTSINENQ